MNTNEPIGSPTEPTITAATPRAVTPLQPRTPLAHALRALTLSQLSGGNFILGIGLSSPNIVQDWGGQPYDRPLSRMRDYIHVLRKALAGEKVSYQGKTLTTKNFRLGGQVTGQVPIYLGALNEQMLRLTGELADGVVLNMVPEHALPQVLGAVRAGAEAAGRDPGELEVIARLHVLMTDDVAAGRTFVRNIFGAYTATPGYNRYFSWIGFQEEAKQVAERFAARDREGVAKAVTDDFVDAIALVGNAETLRRRVRAYAEQGIDVMAINPIADPKAARKTLQELAPALQGLSLNNSGVVRATSQAR
jgi:probable F420-dependent oxidoreductase